MSYHNRFTNRLSIKHRFSRIVLHTATHKVLFTAAAADSNSGHDTDPLNSGTALEQCLFSCAASTIKQQQIGGQRYRHSLNTLQPRLL